MNTRLRRFSAFFLLILMCSLSVLGADDMPLSATSTQNLVTTPTQPTTWGQAFDKHAPLAFFSAGSLAVGGLIAAIRSDNQTPANMRGNASGRDVAWAMGLSGASALVAGVAFWYYAHAEVTGDMGATHASYLPTFLPTYDGKVGWVAGLNLAF